MNTTSNTKRFFGWLAFIVVIALIIWGLIAAQQKSAREELNLVLPTQIATSTDHIRGSMTAPVTLVEYGDFQCPACRVYHPMVEQVVTAMGPDALRFVFRHYPLPQHANAMPAAKTAESAGMQGKFWEMYDMLYDKQAEWENSTSSKAIFVGYAKTLGLDEKKFLEDYDSKAVKDTINNQYKGGMKGGINSTPTFFVNGVKITSPRTYEDFKKIIDSALPKISF